MRNEEGRNSDRQLVLSVATRPAATPASGLSWAARGAAGLTAAAALALLGGCGQKGPLFLPPPATTATPAAPAPAAPAPAGAASEPAR